MTPAERRQLELNFYETFVGICNEEKIADCEHKDVKFLPGLLAKGDLDCIMTCTKYQMLQNLDNLPNGVKTVKFIQAIGVFLKDLDISKKADKNKLTEMNRKGCAALGGSECAEKRLIGFFTTIVLFSVAKVGLFSKLQQAILSLPSKWWELSVILLSFMLSIFFIAFNLHLPFFPACLINKIDEIDINRCQLID